MRVKFDDLGGAMDPKQANPEDLHIAAAEAQSQLTQEHASISAQLARRLFTLRNECKNEIRAVVGVDNLGRYLEFHAKTKKRLAELPNATQHTTRGLNEAGSIRAATVKEAKEYVAQLGIDSARIKEIQRRYVAQLAAAENEAMPGAADAPYVDITADNVPTMVHNPWTWVGPPYDDSWGYLSQGGSRGARYYHKLEDPVRGTWDTHSTMTVNGADDSDVLYLSASSDFEFWFQMPATGLVEVWLFMQSLGSSHSGNLEDEWGNSDAEITLNLRPRLLVTWPWSWTYNILTLVEYGRGEREGSWSNVIAPLGEFRYAHFFSSEVYEGGQMLRCTVALGLWHRIWLNDMSCHHDVSSRWFIPHVAIRSTGAP